MVPFVVPLTKTLTPIAGYPVAFSVTTPVTVRFCANIVVAASNRHKQSINLAFIHSSFKVEHLFLHSLLNLKQMNTQT